TSSLARGDINNDGIQDLLVGAPGREVSKTPGRVWVLYGSNKTLWKTTNDKFDTIHLENRRWYLTTKGFLFNSMDLNTKIPRGTDFVFIGDINNISPVGSGFGIFITVGDLSPFAGDDVIIIDAYGRGPGQDTLDPGPGAAYVFYEHPPVAEISVAPLSIDFGDIITDYYRTQEILIKNTGEANLNIYSINTSGDGSISQTNDCPDILNPKESCIVTVLFSPEIAGIHSGTLTIHSSDPLNERVNVTITGNVITNPDIDVQPQKLIFLDVPLGNKVSKNINITNNGISELHISDILLGSTIHYTQTNNCAVTIAPGETCTITVTYDPVSQVYFTHWADLIIRSDDPDEPEVVVALSGHGIPPFISVEPESINLGAAETNAILSISNTSSSNILSWSITPDLPSWLAVSTTSGETSPSVFERLIVSVDRTGLDAGLYQHNLSITSSGGVVSVPVSMEVSPYISVSPATVDFREAKTRSMITIENTSPTTTISWSINNDLPSWLAVSQGSGILVPGSSIDVYLYADRTGLASDNTYTHILTITSNGGDKTVPVSMTVPVQLATFARYYGDSGSYGGEYFSVVRSTSDGGYIASGLTNSFGADADNPWIVKLDSSGYIQWEYRYPGYGRVYDIKEVSDGGYMVVSSIQYHREFRYFYILRIFKINRYGDMEWQKLYDSEIDENMDNWGINFQIVEAVDGGFVIAGNKYVGGRSDFRVLKIDPSGNILWEKTYGGIYDDYANSIDLTSDGGYIVAGVTEVDDTNKTDLWILKIDSSGNIQWQKRYDDRGWNYAYQIKETSEGGYIVVGTTLRTGSAFLLKLDSSGNILWQKSYGEYGSQYYGSYGYSISQTADGGYIMTGVLSNRDGTGDNIWIVRVDQSGDILWQKRYGGDSTDVAYWIEQTIESDYVVAGYTRSFRNTPYGSDNYDAWIMKTDTLGNIGMSCTLIDWTEIVPAESSFVVFETSVIPVDSTSLVIDFPTKPVDTNSTADQICTETVSEAQERDLVDITVEQTSYNFYGVLIGETVSHTFYIKNTGYQPLQINNITLSADQEFSLTHDCPLLLNAANMCRLTVSFTPVTDAEKSGFVSIESDDPDEPVVYINLTGSGYICYECPGEGGGVIFRPP
ncbi:MAG: choice-of-anchor D domain-containing protein, partial [Nitrospirae bacterium]|nr:choice-of-anchor D domain-containing protein [Nitrospirota bacterium]